MYEDIIIEIARIERELTQRIERQIKQQQLGEAWGGVRSSSLSRRGTE